MEGDVDGHPGDFMAKLRKLDAPGKICWLAPATTGGETTLTPKKVPDGNTGRAGICRLPPGKFVAPHQEVTSQGCAKETSVKNST